MTAPNEPTPSDTIAARELMLTWLTPAFRKPVLAGELDGFGLFNRAMAQLIRERAGEEVSDG
jgi:hypothetical protein